jgi:hypothetical protein
VAALRGIRKVIYDIAVQHAHHGNSSASDTDHGRNLVPDAGGSGYAERSVPPAIPGAPGARNSTRTWSTLATLDGQLAQRCALTPVHKTILGALDGPEPPRLFDVTPTSCPAGPTQCERYDRSRPHTHFRWSRRKATDRLLTFVESEQTSGKKLRNKTTKIPENDLNIKVVGLTYSKRGRSLEAYRKLSLKK